MSLKIEIPVNTCILEYHQLIFYQVACEVTATPKKEKNKKRVSDIYSLHFITQHE